MSGAIVAMAVAGGCLGVEDSAEGIDATVSTMALSSITEEVAANLAPASDKMAPRAACKALLFRGQTKTFSDTDVTVTAYPCLGDDPRDSRTFWVDPKSGAEVDIEALERKNAVAFHNDHSSMDPNLRKHLESVSVVEVVDTEVWFWVEERDLPYKEELLDDPLLAQQADQILQERYHEGAQELVKAFAAIAQRLPDAPDQRVLSNLAVDNRFVAPVITVRAPKRVLQELGRHPSVVWMGKHAQNHEDLPLSENYYTTSNQIWVQGFYGFNGAGTTVAVVEREAPDAYDVLNGGALSGSCAGDDPSDKGKCYCPNGFSSFVKGWHPRQIAGVIRNASTSFGGMANGVNLIFGNWGADANEVRCAGADTYGYVLRWSTDNGASIINQSFGGGAGSPQDATDRLDDYVATHNPYPLFVSAAGNSGFTSLVIHSQYNGLVVGGTDNAPSRGDQRMYSVPGTPNASNGTNYAPPGQASANYFELPHVTAAAMNVDTAPHDLGSPSVSACCGTSLAVPQVSAIAASVQQINTALKSHPEVIIPGFLVGADANTDSEFFYHPWPLNLNDNIDDYDGAGYVNALLTGYALGPWAKVNGGNVAVDYGHDYQTITSTQCAYNSPYGETYYANVPAGATLRAAALLTANPTCNPYPLESNCTSSAYPLPWLKVYDSSNQLISASIPMQSNYALASYKNTSSSAKTVSIKLFCGTWSGLTSAHMGFAWFSSPEVQ